MTQNTQTKEKRPSAKTAIAKSRISALKDEDKVYPRTLFARMTKWLLPEDYVAYELQKEYIEAWRSMLKPEELTIETRLPIILIKDEPFPIKEPIEAALIGLFLIVNVGLSKDSETMEIWRKKLEEFSASIAEKFPHTRQIQRDHFRYILEYKYLIEQD